MQISYAFLALFVLLLVLTVVTELLKVKQTVIFIDRKLYFYCNLVVTLATFGRQLVAIRTLLNSNKYLISNK